MGLLFYHHLQWKYLSISDHHSQSSLERWEHWDMSGVFVSADGSSRTDHYAVQCKSTKRRLIQHLFRPGVQFNIFIYFTDNDESLCVLLWNCQIKPDHPFKCDMAWCGFRGSLFLTDGDDTFRLLKVKYTGSGNSLNVFISITFLWLCKGIIVLLQGYYNDVIQV